MRRNFKNLDERQLLQRGNVFQHSMILLFILLMLDAFLKEDGLFLEKGLVWAEGMWENILIVWAALALCFSEFIILEIAPLGKSMGIFYTVMGCVGAFIAIVCACRIAAGHVPFVVGHTLTSMGSEVIQGCFMVLIFLVFLGKKLYNFWAAKRGDEE